MTYIRSKSEMSKKIRWGMVIDLDKCTGCRACVVACKQENNVMPNTPEQSEKGRTISWMEVLTITVGEYPDVSVRYLPRPCMHCQNPPCVKVCPVSATFLGEEGLVGQVYPRCIGCRYCMNACPYNAKFFNWLRPDMPSTLKAGLNPDVTVRPKGVVEKCTFCVHRIQKAKERAKREKREIKEEDVVPACAEVCPTKAIVFGNLLDKGSRVFRLANGPRAFKLMGHIGTEPNVFYLSEGEWLERKAEISE